MIWQVASHKWYGLSGCIFITLLNVTLLFTISTTLVQIKGARCQVPWPLGRWRWWLADDSINMWYTYVGIDAHRFTYQFLGELFRVWHICHVTWIPVKRQSVEAVCKPQHTQDLRLKKTDTILKTIIWVCWSLKDLLYSRVSAINPVSTRKIFLPFAFRGALEFFGAWLGVDTLPYNFYGTLCVVCNQNSANSFSNTMPIGNRSQSTNNWWVHNWQK